MIAEIVTVRTILERGYRYFRKCGKMKMKWVYAVMVCIAIGTIFVIGSITVNTGPGNDPAGLVTVDKVRAESADVSGSIHEASLYTNITSGKYRNWFACTYPSDSSSLLIYKVPAGKRFQLDDVVMTTGIATGYSYGIMYRGASGSSFMMEAHLNPHERFGQQFKGMVLKSGEQLKIRSHTSGDANGLCWAITGHLIT